MEAEIAVVRSFNRTVARVIGALNDRYLGRERPLAEARLLFEIGRGGAELRDIRETLGLDSGYLSRLLRSLEEQGLATTPTSRSDRRVRRVRLTRAGVAEFKELNRRSDRLAESLLAPLSERQRGRLVAAMSEIERFLAAATATIAPEKFNSAAAQYCLREYYRELAARFETGFDPAMSIPVDPADFRLPNGAFLVLRVAGRPAGCGAFKRLDAEAVYLKRMWIADGMRGLGLGQRMLAALEESARAHGYRIAKLETNKTLAEAQALYRRAGYRETAPFNSEPYAHHWFEKQLA
ncbi:MAG TPA: GNAT family N-acetyltransferase [Parvularculaceae bacterium]|nr:GNAT family N-acetyltransferase [Parvularculaceae bacterium]